MIYIFIFLLKLNEDIQLENSKNEFKLKPEDRLILSCGHSQVNDELEKKIMKLVNLDLDWKYIMDMATRHRLRPLLYHNLNKICPDKVPDDVLASSREFYHSNVRKNLMMTGELVKVMKLLEENGVNAVTYKGPVLAQMAYGNVGYREFGDIDVFISKNDAIKAKKIMLDWGYNLKDKIKVEESLYLSLDSEYRFLNKNKTALIEINWNFEGLFLSFSRSPEFLLSNLETFNYNGFAFKIPKITNHLLMLAIHSSNHNWNRLSWINDIAQFIRINNIYWSEVLIKAEEIGVKRILLINLFLAKDLFDLDLPEEVLIHIKSDNKVQKTSFEIKKRFFNEENLNLFGKLILNLKKREAVKYGIKDCFKSLTKPDYRIFEFFPLPRAIFPLYYFIKPFIIIIKYGSGPI